MFSSEDVVASTAGILGDIVFGVELEYVAKKPGEYTLMEKITRILLKECSDPLFSRQYENYLKVRDQWRKVPGREFVEGTSHYGSLPLQLQNFAWNALLHLLGNSVADAQVYEQGDLNTSGSTDPSHSQLAKDHDNHPLHTLAAMLAKEAVRNVGKAFCDIFDGKR